MPVYTSRFFVQSQQDAEELDDEDEVNRFAHHWSDEDFETHYTEQGYEADTETNLQDDWHRGNNLTYPYTS